MGVYFADFTFLFAFGIFFADFHFLLMVFSSLRLLIAASFRFSIMFSSCGSHFLADFRSIGVAFARYGGCEGDFRPLFDAAI